MRNEKLKVQISEFCLNLVYDENSLVSKILMKPDCWTDDENDFIENLIDYNRKVSEIIMTNIKNQQKQWGWILPCQNSAKSKEGNRKFRFSIEKLEFESSAVGNSFTTLSYQRGSFVAKNNVIAPNPFSPQLHHLCIYLCVK